MKFPIHEVAALGAALCWAVTPLISAPPARHLGALGFNRLRQSAVTLMLALIVLVTGRWGGIGRNEAGWLLASGFAGIFAGDMCSSSLSTGWVRGGMAFSSP